MKGFKRWATKQGWYTKDGLWILACNQEHVCYMIWCAAKENK